MRKMFRSVPRSIWIIGFFLITLRLALPWICLKGFNWALQNKGEVYTGYLEDFDLSLWRGAYQLQGLELKKRNSNLPPLLKVKEIDLSIAWRGLLQGQFLIDADIDDLSLRLIDSKGKNKQYGTEEKKETQEDFLDLVFPVSIERIRLSRSAVYFTNYDFKKALPVALENIQFSIADLRTHRKGNLSPFAGSATLQRHAGLTAQGVLDILSDKISMDVNAQLTNFDLPTVNDILRIYIPIDITNAKLDVYSEFAMANGQGRGYAKIFLNDADVVAGNQSFISIKHFFFEILGGLGNWLLQNPKDKSLGILIPMVLNEKGFNIDSSFILTSALKNRRGDMKKSIDKSIDLKSLNKN